MQMMRRPCCCGRVSTLPNSLRGFDHHFHDLVTFFDVRHFTPTERGHSPELCPCAQGTFSAWRSLVRISSWPVLGRSRISFVFVCDCPVFFLFVLVVLVFTVIHDSANWRPLIGGHFNKIQAGIASPLEGLLCGNDPQLLTQLAHYPDRRDANVLIDAYRIAISFRLVISSRQCH